jgi:nucleoside-diphosphate kinase
MKPDAFKRRLVGEIIKRIEDSNMNISGMHMIRFTERDARDFYKEHKNKRFYEPLVEFMCSGPALVMTIEGEDVVDRLRKLIGPTNPNEAPPGTIRGDLAGMLEFSGLYHNLVHASDSSATADREIAFFKEKFGFFNAMGLT